MHFETSNYSSPQRNPRRTSIPLLSFLWLLLACVTPVAKAEFGERITVEGTEFRAGAQRIWINGANTPWNAWNDFGGSFDVNWWTNHFQTLRDNHINATRVWITCNGDVGINIAADGTVSGATAKHWQDLDSLFQIAQSKGVYIMATLMSFDHLTNVNVNYQRWRAMINDPSKVQTFVDNYIVEFVDRYKTNPFLWSIDLINEPDGAHEEAAKGNIPWSSFRQYFARAAVAIHANSDILVTVGFAYGPKYGSSGSGSDNPGPDGNNAGDAVLQAVINDPGARVDFWAPHHYDWMTQYWGNPLTLSPTAYGLDAGKPALIGEMPARGFTGQSPVVGYESAYVNGWQGAMAWTSNGVDGQGSLTQLAPATNEFYANHPKLVYPVGIPAAPTGLSAAAGDVQVTLSWTGSIGASTYNIYRGTASGSQSSTPIAIGLTTTGYIDTGLTSGTSYFYVVKAVNSEGISGASNEAGATPIAANAPPLAPTGLVAVAGDSQVSLSWTASATGAAAYNIYRGTSSGGEGATPLASGPGMTGTSYSDTSAVNGTTYYYQVRAVNAIGVGAASNEASATPFTPTADTTQYNFENGDEGWATDGGTITGLARSTKRAFAGAASLAITFNSPAGGASAYAYINSPVISAGSMIALRVWVPSASALASLQFYVQTNNWAGWTSETKNIGDLTPNAWNTINLTVPAAATSVNRVGVEFSTNGSWNGTLYIDSVAVTPPLSAPTGLNGTGGNAQAMLSWTATPGATSYRVYRGTTPDGQSVTAIAQNLVTTTYTDTGRTNGTTYFYKVRAVSGSILSPYSNEAIITPIGANAAPEPTGLTAVAGNRQVMLSWTPSAGATAYSVFRGTAPDKESTTAVASNITTTTFTNTGLTNGTRYYYKVKASKGTGATTSGYSNEANAVPALPADAAFNDWAAELPAEARGPQNDPEGDGVLNLLEFALGSDALTPAPDQRTVTTVTVGGQVYPALRFVRRSSLGGVTVDVLVSAAPDFSANLGVVEVSATDRGDGTQMVVVRSVVPLSAQPRQFFRITAALPSN